VHDFSRKLSKSNRIFFASVFFMKFFIASARRPWYRKKRCVIPFGILITLLIGGIIAGSVLGAKLGNKGMNPAGSIFLINLLIGREFNIFEIEKEISTECFIQLKKLIC
jgi:hypothetical protein